MTPFVPCWAIVALSLFSTPAAHAAPPTLEGNDWFELIGLQRGDPLVQDALDSTEPGSNYRKSSVVIEFFDDGRVQSVRLYRGSMVHNPYLGELPGGSDWKSIRRAYDFQGRPNRVAYHDGYELLLRYDRKFLDYLHITHTDSSHTKPATGPLLVPEVVPAPPPPAPRIAPPPMSPMAELRTAIVGVAEDVGYTVVRTRSLKLRTDGDRVRTELRYPQKSGGKYVVLVVAHAAGVGDIEFGERGEHGYLEALTVERETRGEFVHAWSNIQGAGDGDHTVEITVKYSNLLGNPDSTELELAVVEYLK
ncbi:MAG: hypothetical protein KC912_10260 [Proteobacteria bacterium]|nr:hypothetical protein [Pseudomonadota bacterium]